MSESGSKSCATDPTASASANPKAVIERVLNQHDAGQTHNSSNGAKTDGVEDTGDTAGFTSLTYSTDDNSKVEIPLDGGKAVDNFLVPDGLRFEDGRQQSYT